MGIASGTVTLFRVAENHWLMLRNSELTGGLGWSWGLQLGCVFDNIWSSSLIVKDSVASINVVDGILSDCEFIIKFRIKNLCLHIKKTEERLWKLIVILKLYNQTGSAMETFHSYSSNLCFCSNKIISKCTHIWTAICRFGENIFISTRN